MSLCPPIHQYLQLAQRIGGYVEDVRASKGSLELSTILTFLADITLEVTGEADSASWDLVAGFVARLGQEAAALLPTLMDQEQVLKSEFAFPSNLMNQLSSVKR